MYLFVVFTLFNYSYSLNFLFEKHVTIIINTFNTYHTSSLICFLIPLIQIPSPTSPTMIRMHWNLTRKTRKTDGPFWPFLRKQQLHHHRQFRLGLDQEQLERLPLLHLLHRRHLVSVQHLRAFSAAFFAKTWQQNAQEPAK